MNELTEQIGNLQPGDHLCLIYDKDPSEQMPALILFIKQGLEQGEQCAYIADDQTVDQVTRALEESGIEVSKELKRGALLLWTRAEWRPPEECDSDKKTLQVRHFIDAALSAGFTGIRFAVEMTWALGPDISGEKIRDWEATINQIFTPGFPARIICQYSRSRLTPDVVESSLSTHPLAIIGNDVYPNHFYEIPPILDGKTKRGKLDWMISQLEIMRRQKRDRHSEQTSKLQHIFQLNDQVNRAEDLEEIYKTSLDIILRAAKADRSAILLMDDNQVMRFKSWRGLSEEYRRAVEGHSPWPTDTSNPQPICIHDIDAAPMESSLKEAVRHEGIHALGFFPLVYQGRLLGKFMVYYNRPHPFLEDEVNLIQTISGHIAFSIQSKQTEEALRQKQVHLNIALEAGQMGTWEWDIRSGKAAWSTGLEAIHGLEPGTFGGTFEDFKREIHPDDLGRVLDTIAQTLEEKSTFHVEYRIIRSNEAIKWLEARGRLFLDPSGKPDRMIGVCTDITDRKSAEEASLHLSSIVESSEDAIISKSLKGVIQSWNKGAERIFGYSAEEAIGRPVTLLIPADRISEEAEILRRINRGERIEHYETIRIRKDGKTLSISLTVSPVKDQYGRIIGVSKIARDITQRREAEREREESLAREQKARSEAQEANRLRDEFLATVSHELRTPLNAIYGWTRLLRMGDADDQMYETALETIERNALSQARLIDDLLDVSRIIAGKFNLQVSPVDIPPVIAAVVDTLRPAASAKGIQVHTALDSSIGPVLADPDRLQQVIWNLLSNAIKFTPDAGQVEVRLERVDPYVEVSVKDTGIGISSDFLPYVFDRFRQAEGSSIRSQGGLGLGLAIVRHLVELHGGTVSAESRGNGQGATFKVKLPIRAVRIRPAALQPPHSLDQMEGSRRYPRVLEGLQVLLVDDESDARDLLTAVIERYGARVAPAGSAEEALESAMQQRPDLLIADIGMPGMDGYVFIDRFRSWEKSHGFEQIPAIALTAYAGPEDRRRALSAGFRIHIAKPVEPTELITVMVKLISRSGEPVL
ncbi:MAG: PAS domain S-box protein [Candidatus Manganitrophus sp. SB1]|nr:PAS domain S-box protein [Candidatus Manganitrophus morganii]